MFFDRDKDVSSYYNGMKNFVIVQGTNIGSFSTIVRTGYVSSCFRPSTP